MKTLNISKKSIFIIITNKNFYVFSAPRKRYKEPSGIIERVIEALSLEEGEYVEQIFVFESGEVLRVVEF